ncbi:hypothetical protein F5B20DRAFT_557688 [Whalleya microplaca]|nr:hypothetical protein F5B20DRAFT_557688 [Whalleya microplaca]
MASGLSTNIIRIEPSEMDEKKRAYFILGGIYTGDIWHCAAAQILSEYRHKDKVFPHPKFFPITACVVYGSRSGKSESDCSMQGKASYNYLNNIGLPCVVVETESSQAQLSYKTLKGAMDWEVIESLYISQKQVKPPNYEDFRQKQKPLSLKQNDNYNNPFLLRYDVSTTIMMQLMEYLGVNESLQILSQRLWDSGQSDSSAIKEQAQGILRQLTDLINRAKFKDILLFNYRQSSKNAAYNSNDRLLENVRREAERHQVSIITIAVGAGKNVIRREQFKDSLDIYNAATGTKIQDKRITACFWSLVAQQLQVGSPTAAASGSTSPRRIRGLIGGRSGSIDIASFVGVKVMSWDEPLFESKVYSREKQGQIIQLCRLLNQKPVSFICYYDPSSLLPIPEQEISGKKRKRETGEKKGSAPNVSINPKDEKAQPREYQSLEENSLVDLLGDTWPENQGSPLDGNMYAQGRAQLAQAIDGLSVVNLGIVPNYLQAAEKGLDKGDGVAIAKAKAELPPPSLPDYTENVYNGLDSEKKVTEATFVFPPDGTLEFGQVDEGENE